MDEQTDCQHFVKYLTSDFQLVKCTGHTDEIRTICFSKNKQYMFSGAWDNLIHKWQIPTNGNLDTEIQPCLTFKGHTGNITDLCICEGDQILISSSKDGTVKVWDIHNGQCLFTLGNQKEKIYSVTLSKDLEYIISGGEDRKIRLWKILRTKNVWKEVKCIKELPNFENTIHSIQISADMKYFAVAGDEKRIKLYTFPECQLHEEIDIHQKNVYCIDFHPTLPILISVGKEKRIYQYNYEKKEVIRVIPTTKASSMVKFSHCGGFFMNTTFNNQITIYNTSNAEICRDYRINDGKNLVIGLSNDWLLLAIAPFQISTPKIKLWYLKTKQFTNTTNN
jgi:WD40 repeat protein